MTKFFSRNAVRVAGAALIALLSLALLASCAPAEKEKTPAQLNREYMASVSENVEDLAAELQVFSDATSKQDVASMALSAQRATKIIGAIEALPAPEALTEVHAAYVAGAQQLMAAIDDYVALYTDLHNDAIEEGEAQTRLKTIQADYDKGIAQLKEADALAAKVAGLAGKDAKPDSSAGSTKADSSADSTKADSSADSTKAE